MADSVDESVEFKIVPGRPLERNIALYAICVAVLIHLGLTIREVVSGTPNGRFAEVLAVCCLLICATTFAALPNQDESYRFKINFLPILVVAGAVIFAFFSVSWASLESLGLNPSLLPGLTVFICITSHFAVSNQMSYGLGSLIPKAVLMSFAMHFTDNSDWGILSSNSLVSPQTAIAALAIFSVLASTIFLAVKSRTPSWLMFLLGVLIPLPCMIKIELPLVVFHVL